MCKGSICILFLQNVSYNPQIFSMSLSDTPESIIELLEEVIEEATEDKENVASKAKTRWTMAYRAVRKGSDEEVFTLEKFKGKNFR